MTCRSKFPTPTQWRGVVMVFLSGSFGVQPRGHWLCWWYSNLRTCAPWYVVAGFSPLDVVFWGLLYRLFLNNKKGGVARFFVSCTKRDDFGGLILDDSWFLVWWHETHEISTISMLKWWNDRIENRQIPWKHGSSGSRIPTESFRKDKSLLEKLPPHWQQWGSFFHAIGALNLACKSTEPKMAVPWITCFHFSISSPVKLHGFTVLSHYFDGGPMCFQTNFLHLKLENKNVRLPTCENNFFTCQECEFGDHRKH